LYESECNAPIGDANWRKKLDHEIWLSRYEFGRIARGEVFVEEMVQLSADEYLEKSTLREPGTKPRMSAAQMRKVTRKICPDIAICGDAHQMVSSMRYEEAFELFREAAKIGSPEGMFNVGQCFLIGRGVSRDFEKAKEWLLKASKSRELKRPPELEALFASLGAPHLGVGEALHQLGLSAETGVFGPIDHVSAANFYRQACEFNQPGSLHNLAIKYLNGVGVPYNPKEAVQLLLRASNHPYVKHTPQRIFKRLHKPPCTHKVQNTTRFIHTCHSVMSNKSQEGRLTLNSPFPGTIE
jgi:TPR repeat protein